MSVLLDKMKVPLRRSSSRKILVLETSTPSADFDLPKNLELDLGSLRLENGQFEATLLGSAIPHGVTQFRKSGYTIEITVYTASSRDGTSPIFRGIVKLPIYVDVSTVSVNLIPTDGNFKIRGTIFNSRYAADNKTQTNVLDARKVVVIDSTKRKTLRRRNSSISLEGIDLFNAGVVTAKESSGRKTLRRRTSSVNLDNVDIFNADKLIANETAGRKTLRKRNSSASLEYAAADTTDAGLVVVKNSSTSRKGLHRRNSSINLEAAHCEIPRVSSLGAMISSGEEKLKSQPKLKRSVSLTGAMFRRLTVRRNSSSVSLDDEFQLTTEELLPQ